MILNKINSHFLNDICNISKIIQLKLKLSYLSFSEVLGPQEKTLTLDLVIIVCPIR